MKPAAKLLLLAAATLLCAGAALAKLPAISDEAKAKAAEAAAKTAWNGKIDGYLLCKAQDRVVAHHAKTNKAAKTPVKDDKLAKDAGKDAKAAPAKPAACADPGPYVSVVAAPAGAPAPAAAAAPAKKS